MKLWTSELLSHVRAVISLIFKLLCVKNSNKRTQNSDSVPGGALSFLSGRGVRPGFPKCGACERQFASEKGGL